MSDLIVWFMANAAPIIGAVVSALTAILAIALVIPGDQPDKLLQSILDFIKKLSVK